MTRPESAVTRREALRSAVGVGVLLAAGGCTGAGGDASRPSSSRTRPSQGTVTASDGAGLHYVDTGGDGPVLMLVPGWSTSLRWWHKQLDGLADGHRVISMDPRGHGDSEKVEHGHRLARHAADIDDMLRARGVSEVTLVGWSLAANVLLSYNELFHGDRVARMVYIEASPYAKNQPDIPLEQPGWDLGYAPVEAETAFIASYRDNPRSVVGEVVDLLFAEPPSAKTRAWMVEDMLKTPAATAVQIEWDFYNADWRAVVPNVQMPMLVVNGRRSQLYPVRAGEWLADHLPKGRQVVFDHSGHAPFLEQPTEFNRVLAGFARE